MVLGAFRGGFRVIVLGTVSMAVATAVVLANSTANSTANIFVDEETAELMYNSPPPASVKSAEGLAPISLAYNDILRNALASGNALKRTFSNSGGAYCWQCEAGVYVEALERLPIPLRELSAPSANMSARNYTRNYTHLLRNPYAGGIDVNLLKSVVVRLDIATIRSSYSLYNSSFVETPTYPITSLESIRSNVQVVYRQLSSLCQYGSAGYSYTGSGVAGVAGVGVGVGVGVGASGAGVGAGASAGVYCDYAKWVQLRYIIEGVPTLLITYSAMDIAVLLVEVSELTSAVSGSTVAVLPLSSRGLQGMEFLKESLYGEMLRDYSKGRGAEAYLKALVLQRLDILYSPYTHGERRASFSVDAGAESPAESPAESYWQGVASTYAKESYHLMEIRQAPLVALGGGCWEGLGSPEDGEGLFLQNLWLLAPQYGTGDAPAQINEGSIICLPTASESTQAEVLIINTNRPYQYACKLDTQNLAPCLRTKLKLALTDEVASLLAESAPQVFNHYQSTPIWGTMGAQHTTPPARVATSDILTMSDGGLLLYATYQYLVRGSFTEQ